jgi:hypothetical protein
MAISQNLHVVSFPTNSTALNNSTNQYKFVMATTAGVALPASSNVMNPIGILQNTPTSAEVAAVAVSGVSQLRMAASTLAAGDLVAGSSLGLGVAPSSDANQQGQIIYGSSGGAGRLVSVLLKSGSSG